MPILSDARLPFPSHLTLIPQHLHTQAEDLIALMAELPGNPPSCCPYCNSTQQVRVQVAGRSGFRLSSYRCRQCRATYNALSGTPLADLQISGCGRNSPACSCPVIRGMRLPNRRA